MIDIGGSISTQNMFCDSENNDDFSFIIDDDACDNNEEDESIKNLNFRKDLKKWALAHNIAHIALKDLMKIVNKRFVDKGASSFFQFCQKIRAHCCRLRKPSTLCHSAMVNTGIMA